MDSSDLTLTRSKQRIGLTALIDVVFILLMFFMLTSSFTQRQAVAIPVPSSIQNGHSETETPMLFVSSLQCLQLSASKQSQLHAEDSVAKIISLASSMMISDKNPLLLFTHEKLTLQNLLDVLSELKKAHIPTVFVKAIDAKDMPTCELSGHI